MVERIGKLEKWILIHAYKKTILHDLPEGWKYPRLYKYAPDNDKEFYNNHFLKVDILLNYFILQLSDRLPKEEHGRQWLVKGLEEKFRDTKEYRAALVSCTRTMRKMGEEEKGLIIANTNPDCYEMNTMRQIKYSLNKGEWGANTKGCWGYTLTDKGMEQAKRILNVNK